MVFIDDKGFGLLPVTTTTTERHPLTTCSGWLPIAIHGIMDKEAMFDAARKSNEQYVLLVRISLTFAYIQIQKLRNHPYNHRFHRDFVGPSVSPITLTRLKSSCLEFSRSTSDLFSRIGRVPVSASGAGRRQ